MQRLMTTALLVLWMVAGLSAAHQRHPSPARATQDGGPSSSIHKWTSWWTTETVRCVKRSRPPTRMRRWTHVLRAAQPTPSRSPTAFTSWTVDDPSALGGLDILTGTVILQGNVITPTILDGTNGCRVLDMCIAGPMPPYLR